jgi:hypothetical protein
VGKHNDGPAGKHNDGHAGKHNDGPGAKHDDLTKHLGSTAHAKNNNPSPPGHVSTGHANHSPVPSHNPVVGHNPVGGHNSVMPKAPPASKGKKK